MSEFALCLTHDVDRPYKTYQSVYRAVSERDLRHLRALAPGANPWWQFEEIMRLEDDLGVRSAFYFLKEKSLLERSPSAWTSPHYWLEHLGRYDPADPDIVELMRTLDANGWEVGLHGSYDSYDDRDRLRCEKEWLETALGSEVRGGRQHHLNRAPDTWAHHRDIGLDYDATPGSSTDAGFDRGYDVFRPFDDEFVVFPLTLMEIALPDPGDHFDRAWDECERLLEEAAENDAVMTVLWHPRLFYEPDFPGYRRIYRRLVERAQEMGAWVGPPGDYYDRLGNSDADRSDADNHSDAASRSDADNHSDAANRSDADKPDLRPP